MALFKKWRKRGTGQGEVVETNPKNSYSYENLNMTERSIVGDLEVRRARKANETEKNQADLMSNIFPEHREEIVGTAQRNIDENHREVQTRQMMLMGTSVQHLNRMYKANNAAHRARQRAAGVPEHDILDLESGFEVSGDAISRLRNGKPPKLSTDSPKNSQG